MTAAAAVEMIDPRNLQAEKGVLVALLRAGAANDDLFEIVTDTGLVADHFYSPDHAAAYTAIMAQLDAGKTVSHISMTQVIDPALLNDLASANITHSKREVKEWAEELAELSTLRKTAAVGDEMAAAARSATWGKKPGEIVEEAEAKLAELAPTSEKDGPVSYNIALMRLRQSIAEAQKPENQINRVTTGLTDLDKKLGRFRPGTLNILGGRVSQGKTLLANIIARHNAGQGRRVLFFSLEMTEEEMAARNIAAASGVSVFEQDSIMSATQAHKVEQAIRREEALNLPLEIDYKPARKLTQIRRIARREKRRRGLSMIVIDYLQIMGDDVKVKDAGARTYQIAHNTGGLKALAKELKVPILLLAQVGRGVEDADDHRPGMSDLSDSSSIEKDADVVMFIHREAYYLEKKSPVKSPKETMDKFNQRQIEHAEQLADAQGKAEIIVVKARQTAVPFSVPVAYDGARALVSDLARNDW